MRHRKSGLKLNRTSSHRNAMFRNMVTSLFKHDRISTTDTKAKELKRWADNMITLAKRGDLHARRQALAVICEKDVVHKLFEEAPTRFASVAGGYTRVTKIGLRAGDAAQMSIIELLNPKPVEAKKKTSKKEAPVKAKATEKDSEVVAKEAIADSAEDKAEKSTDEAPEKLEEENKE